MQVPETEQKNQKKFWVLKIIVFETEARNSHNPEQDAGHWQSMCYETPLRINISLREIFSKSGCLRVMEKYDETPFIQILREFGTL